MDILTVQGHLKDMLSYPVSIKNKDLQYIDCNHAFEAFMGVKKVDIVGKNDRELFSQKVAKLLTDADVDCLTYKNIRLESSLCIDKKCSFEVIIYVNRIEEDGKVLGLITSIIDITELKSIEKDLEGDKDIVTSILDTQSNFIIVTDGVYMKSMNRAFLDFFEIHDLSEFNDRYYCVCEAFEKKEGFYSSAGNTINGKHWIDEILTLPEDERIVMIHPKKDERPFYFSVGIKTLKNQKGMYVISFDDITDLIIKSQSLQFAAYHDALTQCYNKSYFQSFLPTIMKKEPNALSLIMFDIDHFKTVNDTFGHLAGDKVLQELCQLVREHIRENDTFIRWGGEEFIIVLQSCTSKDATKSAEHFRKLIQAHEFSVVGKLTSSFGVTGYYQGETLEVLLERLDKELYKAKKSGRNCVCSWDEALSF